MNEDCSTDLEIIQRVLRGNANAFEPLVTRYSDLVFGIAAKHVPYDDIEETAQNVFVRAYQSLSTFKGKSRFRHWLASIAVRTCYDYWRKAYRSREVPMSSLNGEHRQWLEETASVEDAETLHDRVARKEASEVLEWALNQLSPEDRMVIELVHLEGMSGKEAAEFLGWSVANVKVRSFRVRRRLRCLLEDIMQAG